MLFKKIFLSALVFSSIATYAYGYTIDNISLLPASSEVKINHCHNCPIPGKECRNYIITSTDKICLSSHMPNDSVIIEEPKANITVHEKSDIEDVRTLTNDLHFPQNTPTEHVIDMGESVMPPKNFP